MTATTLFHFLLKCGTRSRRYVLPLVQFQHPLDQRHHAAESALVGLEFGEKLLEIASECHDGFRHRFALVHQALNVVECNLWARSVQLGNTG